MTRYYRITHRTDYRYSDVVTNSYGRGHLAPRDTDQQRCLDHRLDIAPAPSDRTESADGYGNRSTYFQITEHHRELTVTGTSVVAVDPPPASLYGDGAAIGPWENARPAGPDGALAVEFTLDLADPEITDEVRAYAAPSFVPGRRLIDVLADLNSRIHSDFTYRSGSTTVSTRVAEVLEAREGVCQDFARLAIACLRANGLAASYVSGYLATDPPPGKERMVGIDATHDQHDGSDRYRLARCPFNPDHGKGEAAIFRRASGALGFKCQHAGCATRPAPQGHSPATARTCCGCASAVFQTIGAPQSWPTRMAGAPGCRCRAAPAMSAVICSSV